MLGLCEAAERWDEERGAFSSYAGRWIRGSIKQEFVRRKKHFNTISLETEVGEDATLEDLLCSDDVTEFTDILDFADETERKVAALYECGYHSQEIADILELPVQKVRKIRRLLKLKEKKSYE